jgi:hypothetical protein
LTGALPRRSHLIASGLVGEPTAPVIGIEVVAPKSAISLRCWCGGSKVRRAVYRGS